LKKLLRIKSSQKVKTSQGPVTVETDDPVMAEVIAKAWDTGDTVIYENGKMTTIPNPSKKPKDTP
jgi:hypothetical protein